MISWELPHDEIACPRCGSTDTHVTLQLLGLVRYTCESCKKSFAVNDAGEPTKAADDTKPVSDEHKPSAHAR